VKWPALLGLALVASGCNPHHDELMRRQAEADALLASAMQSADGLMAARRRLEPLREEVRRGLEEFPDLKSEESPVISVPPRATLPPLPPASVLETSGDDRLRQRIADTRARLAQLEKINAEMERLLAEEARLRKVADAIRERRAAIK